MWTVLLTSLLASPGPDTEHWLRGAPVPPVALRTLDGEPAGTPWANREAVVVLWAGWCGPCVTELPVLAQAIEQLGTQHLPVTLISADDTRTVAHRAQRRAVRGTPPWTSTWAGPTAAGQLGARTLPTTYRVTTDGTIRSVWTGHQDAATWAEILRPADHHSAAPAPMD